jgi:hypothetical protein
MENEELVRLRQLCEHYEIEMSFIRSLGEIGVVEIVCENDEDCIPQDQIAEVEKMIRLHYDLEINMAGLDAISHLLKRINALQKEMNDLRNRIGSF